MARGKPRTVGKRLSITLAGDVPSKKNSKRVVRAGSRTVVLPSAAHEAWRERALWAAKGKAAPVATPAAAWITVYPSTARRADLTNKAESVMDLLVELGVLPDDDWFSVPAVSLRLGGVDRANPRAEVTVESIPAETT